MQIVFHKMKGAADRVVCVRRDGSRTDERMARQGILPHDLLHFAVENALDLRDGLYGHVARGASIRFGEEANPATVTSIELAQAESLVECFQAEEWGRRAANNDFVALLDVTCRARDIPPPRVTERDLERAREAIDVLTARWQKLSIGETLILNFPLDE